MKNLPALTGWLWLKQGFGLFRKQPGALTTLFLGYMFLMLTASVLPYVGEVLPVILVPVFSMTFMQACVNIEQGKRVFPSLLLVGFRKPAFPTLCLLGLLYLMMAVMAIGASALVDGGAFWQLVTGQVESSSELSAGTSNSGAIGLSILLFVPAAMGFCFAAPLICWQKQSLGKAIFFSFFAIVRSLKAFLVFTASWFAVSVFISQLVLLIFNSTELAIRVMLPLSMIMTVILHCSLYASYCEIFGAPSTVSLEKAEPTTPV